MFKNYRDDIKRLLQELKQLGAVAVKSEFEEECAAYEEVELIKNLARESGLKLALKIGGCSAYRDMKDAKKLDADIIVAPMVESAYALRKFLNGACKFALNEKELYISIETSAAFSAIDDIVSAHEFSMLDGVVFGRTDFGRSINAPENFAESEQCLSCAASVLKAVSARGKKLVVGGSVSAESLKFFESLNGFHRFETRKIVFDRCALNKISIEKALEFEILWLKSQDTDSSKSRIAEIEQRLFPV